MENARFHPKLGNWERLLPIEAVVLAKPRKANLWIKMHRLVYIIAGIDQLDMVWAVHASEKQKQKKTNKKFACRQLHLCGDVIPKPT
jgi:DMSO/TMAO reductase YedYZ heme-binding membrane subunit